MRSYLSLGVMRIDDEEIKMNIFCYITVLHNIMSEPRSGQTQCPTRDIFQISNNIIPDLKYKFIKLTEFYKF